MSNKPSVVSRSNAAPGHRHDTLAVTLFTITSLLDAQIIRPMFESLDSFFAARSVHAESGSAQEQAVDAAAYVAKVGLVASGELHRGAPRVVNCGGGFPPTAPFNVTFAK